MPDAPRCADADRPRRPGRSFENAAAGSGTQAWASAAKLRAPQAAQGAAAEVPGPRRRPTGRRVARQALLGRPGRSIAGEALRTAGGPRLRKGALSRRRRGRWPQGLASGFRSAGGPPPRQGPLYRRRSPRGRGSTWRHLSLGGRPVRFRQGGHALHGRCRSVSKRP